MRLKIGTALFLVVLCLNSWPQAKNAIDPNVQTSMVRVIANPKEFDGKKITVVGFLDLTYEGDALYLHKEDADNLLDNALWLDTTEELGRRKDALDLKYVRMTGTFRAGPRGRQTNLVGGITQIVGFGLWSDPAHPEAQAIHDRVIGRRPSP